MTQNGPEQTQIWRWPRAFEKHPKHFNPNALGAEELESLSASEGQLSCQLPRVAGSEVSVFAVQIFAVRIGK